MKKVWWIVIIALILCGVFLVYKKYLKKDENNAKIEENVSVNANINADNKSTENNIKKGETNNENEIKESEEENRVLNESPEENSITVEEQNITNDDKTSETKIEQKNSSNIIKETLAPSGFMGSSLLRVVLYENGEVYLVRYDGEGYEDKNIENKELLATNASEIKSKGSGEDFEAIVINGSSKLKVKNKNYSWIEFEN